jgi:hypothetical protein
MTAIVGPVPPDGDKRAGYRGDRGRRRADELSCRRLRRPWTATRTPGGRSPATFYMGGWTASTVAGSTCDSHACALLLCPDCYVAWPPTQLGQIKHCGHRCALHSSPGSQRHNRSGGTDIPRNMGRIRSPTHRTAWRSRQSPTKESSRDWLSLSNLVRTLNPARTVPLQALRLRTLPSAAGLRRMESRPVRGGRRQPHSRTAVLILM